MTDTPTRVEICCCGDCEAKGHEQQKTVPLTADEIAAMEAMQEQMAQERADREAAEAATAALKASAKAKLVAGTPLTEEEAAVLTI
jgi:hypothetical protein